MQTRFRFPLLFCAAAILILASCGKSNKEGKSIPKNAMLVVMLNGESLNSKLPWDEIKKNEAFVQAYSDSTLPPFVKGLMDNPENSGIDVKNTLTMYMVKDSIGGYLAILGTVKDAAKFSTFNTMVLQGTPTDKDGITYMSKSPTCVGWNKEKFIYLVDVPQLNMMDGNNNYDSEKPSRDISLACKAAFDLKEDNSLAKDEKFTALVKEKADVHYWFKSSEMMAGNMAMRMLGMTKIGDLLKDNLSTGTLNFEDGKIVLDSKGYSGKQLTELFKKYSGDDISTDMVKGYPGKNIAGVFAFNFKPEGVRELLKLTGLDGMANMGLTKAGLDFTVDDFVKGNKGDIFFAASDITMKEDTVRYGTGPTDFYASSKPDLNYIFAASINDKASFANLIKAGQKMGGGMGTDANGEVKAPFSYSSNDKFFAIGPNKAFVDQYLAGGNNDFNFLKKIGAYPMGFYVDIQTVLKSFEKDASKDSSGKMIYDESLKIWQDASMTGGKWDDGAMTSKLEVNFMDKSTNSLKQLNAYIAKIVHIEQEQRKKRMAEYDMRSDSMKVIQEAPAAPSTIR